MKYVHRSFPLFILVSYVAITLMAATSVVADAAKTIALSGKTEGVDLGSMVVTAPRERTHTRSRGPAAP